MKPALVTALQRLAMAVVLVALTACSSSVELLSGLPEQDANECLAVLLTAGISAEKTSAKAGINLKVSSSDLPMALSLLHTHGLPRERYARMGDVFKKENLVSSPLEERARYLFALSQELEMTLSQIDGVLVARVHVVLPEQASAIDPLTPASAAVFLKYKAGARLQALLPQVRALVAGSIPGLSDERVTVALVPATDGRPTATAQASDLSVSNDAASSSPSASSGKPRWLLWGGGVVAFVALVLGVRAWQIRGTGLE